MTKNPEHFALAQARGDTVINLEAIQLGLSTSIDEGMIDNDDAYYNQILALIDEATLSKTWDELMEVISKAKTLEIDIAAFYASKGKTTIALSWPKPPNG